MGTVLAKNSTTLAGENPIHCEGIIWDWHLAGEGPVLIGAVLRFPENRKYPNDFALEVDDLMRSILEGRAVDAAEKRIDNLLGGM